MTTPTDNPSTDQTATSFTLLPDLVKSWNPCVDGYRWFLTKFPQGGAYTAVYAALCNENKLDDARWLFRAALTHALSDFPAATVDLVDAQRDEAKRLIEATATEKLKTPDADDLMAPDSSSGYAARIGSSENAARIGSSGYHAQICSSGKAAQIGSSGYAARIGSNGYAVRIGSSGNAAQIGSSGNAAQIGSSGNAAQIGSSGDVAQIGSSGCDAQIGSSGDVAQIASSGYAARIGSSGNAARIGSSGDAARIGSSGDAARIGSSGDDARINATGERSVIACAGLDASVKAGADGAIALAYRDKAGRTRFAVGYVGESIDADTWYRVNSDGEFVKDGK